jgi:ATP-dependent Clp protease ATP-binding subunit ClpC
MNETTVTQLKIIVERAVRPVRATIARKRKMREELLAHVTAVFEEEAKLHAESVALERMAVRFGDVGELTRQLQDAIPASDALAYSMESFVGFNMQEPVLRRALRYAVAGGVFCTCLLAAFILVIGLVKGSWREWVTLARLPSLLAPVWMATLIFVATFLENGMRQALFGPGGRSWPRAIAIGLLTWLFVPSLVLAWSIAISGVFVASVLDTLPLFLTGALAPVALVIIVTALISEIRYVNEWANLPVNAGKEHR